MGDPRRTASRRDDIDTEEPLTGGNVSAGVVRVGDTVRRPAGPHTPAVHALLAHLQDVGFRHAPRPSGVDEHGREVLSYLPGRPIHPDRRDLIASDAVLARIGRMIRDFHDAAASFVPPPDARWQVLVPDVGADQVVHHDLGPWNVVVADDGALGLIDWDVAAPGTRRWDLAYAAHGFVPLDGRSTPLAVARHRLRVLVDAYGLAEAERTRLVELLPRRTRAMYDLLARGAATGTEPWASLWHDGHGEVWAGSTAYLEQHAADWRVALRRHGQMAHFAERAFTSQTSGALQSISILCEERVTVPAWASTAPVLRRVGRTSTAGTRCCPARSSARRSVSTPAGTSAAKWIRATRTG